MSGFSVFRRIIGGIFLFAAACGGDPVGTFVTVGPIPPEFHAGQLVANAKARCDANASGCDDDFTNDTKQLDVVTVNEAESLVIYTVAVDETDFVFGCVDSPAGNCDAPEDVEGGLIALINDPITGSDVAVARSGSVEIEGLSGRSFNVSVSDDDDGSHIGVVRVDEAGGDLPALWRIVLSEYQLDAAAVVELAIEEDLLDMASPLPWSIRGHEIVNCNSTGTGGAGLGTPENGTLHYGVDFLNAGTHLRNVVTATFDSCVLTGDTGIADGSSASKLSLDGTVVLVDDAFYDLEAELLSRTITVQGTVTAAGDTDGDLGTNDGFWEGAVDFDERWSFNASPAPDGTLRTNGGVCFGGTVVFGSDGTTHADDGCTSGGQIVQLYSKP